MEAACPVCALITRASNAGTDLVKFFEGGAANRAALDLHSARITGHFRAYLAKRGLPALRSVDGMVLAVVEGQLALCHSAEDRGGVAKKCKHRVWTAFVSFFLPRSLAI